MDLDFDFLNECEDGMVLRTRDRSEARILRVDRGEGLIHGDVHMFGACVWHHNGRYRDAPFGAAGPLDLLPPAAERPALPRKRTTMREALTDEGRAFCCD